MIAKRYGKQVHSVEPDFSAVAMNEISFRRDQGWSLDMETFEREYERGAEHNLVASGDGDIQTDVETGILNTLLADIHALEAATAADDVLLIENEPARDYPKLHSTQRTIVVGFENRLHFTYTVDPPLRIGIYRLRNPPAGAA